MASNASIPNMSAKEQYQALPAQVAVMQAQAECKEREERERIEREERERTEQEERAKLEAARVAAEKEEAQKARRAAKRAEKWKAVEEVVEEAEVVVVDGPSEEVRPQKRARTTEANAGPDGEPEMEAAEVDRKSVV